MRNVILFDGECRDHLLPLTFTRPVCELRAGILTIREKWERWMTAEVSYMTQDYLSAKYPLRIAEDNYIINGALLPNSTICQLILELDVNEALLHEGELLAVRLDAERAERLLGDEDIPKFDTLQVGDLPFKMVRRPWDLFTDNNAQIENDFKLVCEGRTSAPLDESNRVIGDASRIFVEAGVKMSCCILNVTDAYMYFGKDVEVMEGAMIRGSLAMCEGSSVKMGSKIYGATTVGPYCRVGGEVTNSVLMGYSNKGHEGYLGNSVLGEWCNIGADTNTSNLKNTYDEVRMWDYTKQSFTPSGQTFLGLVMGDHSKTGINVMFNTGTVVGVSANIFGEGYPRNYIPSFAWGGASGLISYNLNKALLVAERVMARRNVVLSDVDREILVAVHKITAPYRGWEKKEPVV